MGTARVPDAAVAASSYVFKPGKARTLHLSRGYDFGSLGRWEGLDPTGMRTVGTRYWYPVAAAAVAFASPIPSGAIEVAGEIEIPLHPTVVMAKFQGALVPVVGATSRSARVSVGGEMKTLKSDAVYYFNRARRFAAGGIEIRNEIGNSSITKFIDIGGGIDSGVHCWAEVVPAMSY